MPPHTAILDVDGTLVDTNYHHSLAWNRALRRFGFIVQLWKIHRHIGMGGDQIVSALIGEMADSRHGEEIRDSQSDFYGELIGEVEPMAGARDLIEHLHSSSWAVVLASSAKQEEVEHYLDLLDARGIVDAWTSSADVEKTKPEPDLVRSALAKVDGAAAEATMVGDSTWDVRAATAAGVPTVGILTGGFSHEELRDAGAVEVVESVEEVAGALNQLSDAQMERPTDGT